VVVVFMLVRGDCSYDIIIMIIIIIIAATTTAATTATTNTRWFKYDRDYLCVNKSQFVPVIFEPPCTTTATATETYFSSKILIPISHCFAAWQVANTPHLNVSYYLISVLVILKNSVL
jgi:hypothetical protein